MPCSNCGKRGHNIRTCRAPGGQAYEPSDDGSDDSDDQECTSDEDSDDEGYATREDSDDSDDQECTSDEDSDDEGYATREDSDDSDDQGCTSDEDSDDDGYATREDSDDSDDDESTTVEGWRSRLSEMTVKNLKKLASACGVSTKGCYKKADLVERMLAAKHEDSEDSEDAGYYTPDDGTAPLQGKSPKKKTVYVKAGVKVTLEYLKDCTGGSSAVDCGGERCAGVDGSSAYETKFPYRCIEGVGGAGSSWIKYWKMMTGRDPEGKGHLQCAVRGCPNDSYNSEIQGNHVWLEDDNPLKAPCCWIMAGCAAHNAKPTYDLNHNDPDATVWMKLRKGTKLVPAPVSLEMKENLRS